MKKSCSACGSSRTPSTRTALPAQRELGVARARHRLGLPQHVRHLDRLGLRVRDPPRLDAVVLLDVEPLEAREALRSGGVLVLEPDAVAVAALDHVHAERAHLEHVGRAGGVGPHRRRADTGLPPIRPLAPGSKETVTWSPFSSKTPAFAGAEPSGRTMSPAGVGAETVRALLEPEQAGQGQPPAVGLQPRLAILPPLLHFGPVGLVRRRPGARAPPATAAAARP